nr:uncharacterized protein LOC105867231 [Microcebus murinus]
MGRSWEQMAPGGVATNHNNEQKKPWSEDEQTWVKILPVTSRFSTGTIQAPQCRTRRGPCHPWVQLSPRLLLRANGRSAHRALLCHRPPSSWPGWRLLCAFALSLGCAECVPQGSCGHLHTSLFSPGCSVHACLSGRAAACPAVPALGAWRSMAAAEARGPAWRPGPEETRSRASAFRMCCSAQDTERACADVHSCPAALSLWMPGWARLERPPGTPAAGVRGSRSQLSQLQTRRHHRHADIGESLARWRTGATSQRIPEMLKVLPAAIGCLQVVIL